MRVGGIFLLGGLALALPAPAESQAPDYFGFEYTHPTVRSSEPWRDSLPLGFSTSEQAPVPVLEDAANHGVVGAMVELAMRLRGQPEAHSWLVKAAGGGSVFAKYQLARSYEARGALHNAAEARRLDAEVYRLAMSGQRRDLPPWIFDKPIEVPPDAAPAARAAPLPDGADPAALRVDAEAGNVDAMRRLALIYEKGASVWEVAPDQAEAIRWRTLAADAGDIDSLLVMADRRRGISPPTKVVTLGAPGRSEPADPVAALALYQRAAQAGSTRAMLALATMHIDGFAGVPRDPALAEQWARRAYDAGDLQAGLQLALWMRNGRLGRKVDSAELVSILQRVAEGPDENARARAAAANLATMYAIGLSVRVDRAEEARWQARLDALLADKKAAERAANEARSAWLRERAKFWEPP